VFFGITGDLAYKKIFPALHAMARKGHLGVPVSFRDDFLDYGNSRRITSRSLRLGVLARESFPP